MTDSCPPIAPVRRQSTLSALAASPALRSSVPDCNVDGWLAVPLILFASSPPPPPLPVPPSTSVLTTSSSSRWPKVGRPTPGALPYLWLTSLETSAGPSPHTSRHIGQSAPSVKALDVFACWGPVLLWRGACAGGRVLGPQWGTRVSRANRLSMCCRSNLEEGQLSIKPSAPNCRSHVASTVYRDMIDWQPIIPA